MADDNTTQPTTAISAWDLKMISSADDLSITRLSQAQTIARISRDGEVMIDWPAVEAAARGTSSTINLSVVITARLLLAVRDNNYQSTDLNQS